MTEHFLDTESVKAVLDRYFDATYRGDVEELKQIFHEKSPMFGFLGRERVIGTPQHFFDDIGSRASMASTQTDCRSVVRHISVTGEIASAIVLTDGFFGDLCIEDHLLLMKVDGEWKIMSKIFTTIP